MSEIARCNMCGKEYTDARSVKLAKTFQPLPCPIPGCFGYLELIDSNEEVK